MKKGTFLLGSVVQAILFYKERLFSSAGTRATRSADRQLPPELPAIIEQNYEVLYCSTLGRYAPRMPPGRVIQLMDLALLQVAGEGGLSPGSAAEAISYLQHRINETIELNLSKEPTTSEKTYDRGPLRD